jgi:lipoprotein-releasing system ATP-binding protein
MTARLEIQGLAKAYGAQPVLAGLDLAVAAGRVAAVRGASGTGKSTLLQCVGLLDRADAGTIRLDGGDLAALGPRERAAARARRIGFVFQAYHLLPEFTGRENILMAARAAGLPPGPARERAAMLIARLGLDGKADRPPHTLSGGERQRIAVCRALLNRPALLLADEPTGNLDPTTAAQVLDAFLALARDDGAAVVLVTHDPAVAARADERWDLRDGRLHPQAG